MTGAVADTEGEDPRVVGVCRGERKDFVGVRHLAIRQDDDLQGPFSASGLCQHELERRQDVGAAERGIERGHMPARVGEARLVVRTQATEERGERTPESDDVEAAA